MMKLSRTMKAALALAYESKLIRWNGGNYAVIGEKQNETHPGLPARSARTPTICALVKKGLVGWDDERLDFWRRAVVITKLGVEEHLAHTGQLRPSPIKEEGIQDGR